MQSFALKNRSVNDDHVFDDDSTRNILSLEDFTDSHRASVETIIDDVFYVNISKRITRYGRNKDRMHAVNGHASNSVTRSEWKHMFEKEGTKGNKICLTNLVTKFLSNLYERERERVKHG